MYKPYALSIKFCYNCCTIHYSEYDIGSVGMFCNMFQNINIPPDTS